MWSCSGCGELVDEELGSFWNCGTGRDGEPDPEFLPLDSDDDADDDVCPRCGGPRDVIEVGGLAVPQPLCGPCQRELDDLGVEDEEGCCPRDGAVLEKERYRNVIIDRCPECGGVWLDPGELEAIEHAARAGG